MLTRVSLSRFRGPVPLLLVASLVACGGEAPILPADEVLLVEGQVASTAAASAHAPVTISFQDGVSPSASYLGSTDTTLEESLPTTNHGADGTLRLDRDAPEASRRSVVGLLRFDLGAIPPGSTVQSVSLRVNVTNKTSGSDPYVLTVLKRAWSESQATWNKATSAISWSSGGARGTTDRGTVAVGSLLPTVVGPHTVTLNAAGIAAVQTWIDDPTGNHGFALDAQNNADGLFLDSSEATVAANRPRLTVTYVPESGNGTGLLGEYFTGTNHERRVLHRTDATVDFNFGSDAAAPGMPVDGWSVRWTGQVQPLYSQTYTFITRSDDGARLWVNGQQLVNDWNNHGTVENTGTIALVAGRKYDLRLDYYDSTRGAVAQLLWSSPSQPQEIIPSTQLYPATPAPQGFVHPGIFVTEGQLAFVRQQIAAGAQPWTGELAKAKASRFGKTTWVPKARSVIQCGSYDTPNLGCTDSREDALAAYTLTLIWKLTGEQAYADAAIRILDAWSGALTAILYDYSQATTHNGPLQAAWLAEVFPRSAELLRHGPSGWPVARAQRFGTMLTTKVLPLIQTGAWASGSNWNNSMINGAMNIAIYTDDASLFEDTLAQWRDGVRWTIHLQSDGTRPLGPPKLLNADGSWKPGKLQEQWRSQTEFGTARVNGISMEVCRDLWHTQFSLASMSQAAETAYIQGEDLYAEEATRMIAGHEFAAKYLNLYPPSGGSQTTKTGLGSWLCAGTLKLQDLPTWEAAYNHYVNRLGRSMPETARTVTRNRPKASYIDIQMAWETLTHAGVGNAGR